VHLVLINHYAGSPAHGMEFRPHQIARHWVAAGHDVTILAGSFSHLRNRNPEVTGRVAEEFIDGIRYRWLRTPQYQGNGLGRIRSIHAFIRAIDRERRTFLADRRVDAVIASSTYPFDIDPARRIAREHDATLVWEVHDLWPLSPIELAGYSPRHPFIRITQRAEDRCCRDADLVVSILPRAIDHLRTRGLDPARYVSIPNGVDLDEDARPSSESVPDDATAVIDELRRERRFIIGYAGSHTTSYGLDVLIEAVRLAKDVRPGVVFVGDGPEKSQLQSMAADLPGVRFLDRMPRQAAISTLQACDAVFVGLRAEPLFRFGIGMNKIFDAMLVERPVLAAYTAGNDPIGEAGCGITVPAGDSEGLAIAMHRIAAMPPEERRRLGAAGGDFVRRNHDYRRLSRRFLDEIERCRFDSRGASS
jgi:glycosyltransferase involved in cell wall biosynthesis